MFLHFIATGKFELLGILVLSRWRNIGIQAPHNFKTLFAFVVLTLFKLPDPGASIYVQSLLKFPTWGAQGRSKSPPRPVVCLNSWVVATATIGLKTKQKKAFTTLFAEGNTADT